jgi:hypothetical protein
VDGEPSVSREDTCRASRVRPYHGRVAEFIYFRSGTIRSYDLLWLAIGSFVIGMLAGFMWSYSSYVDQLVRLAPELGW